MLRKPSFPCQLILSAICLQNCAYPEVARPDLSWMKSYVGRPAGDVVNDSRFNHDVFAYLPNVPIRLGGESKPKTPAAAAQATMILSQYVKSEGEIVAASGCLVHACGESAGLVLANISEQHPSLTLAFAIQEINREKNGSPPVLMKLFLYVPKNEDKKVLSPQEISSLEEWLRSCFIDHIDAMYVTRGENFVAVSTPDQLRSVRSENRK
jgi:hypothetical protein